jgi:predicted GH43/DUF377 family glycosyl hydrolase
MAETENDGPELFAYRLKNLESLYKEIKGVQEKHGERLEKMAGENISINGKLDILIAYTESHNKYHEKKETDEIEEAKAKKGNTVGWANAIIPVSVTILIFIFGILETQNSKNIQAEILKSNSALVEQVQQMIKDGK